MLSVFVAVYRQVYGLQHVLIHLTEHWRSHLGNDVIHAFFYKEPTSRPSSKSSLFVDLKSAKCSTKSSVIFKCHKNSTEKGKT